MAGFWFTRKDRICGETWFSRLALLALPMPFLGSAFGWIFTEVGRQPWVVTPNPTPGGVDGVWMMTWRGVSTVVSPAMVWTSLIVFTLLYGLLAVIWGKLMHRYAIEGVPAQVHDESPEAADHDADAPLSFAY